MGKKLEITSDIAAAISKATDGAVDPKSVSVFEAKAYNTLPVRKRGSIFNGATTTEKTLREMEDYVNRGEFVPLHTLHMQGMELPVGRVFQAKTTDEGGVHQLHTQFFLPNESEAELIEKLDTGAIEEVSVGVSFQHLLCSECGWDYLGSDATMDHLWDQTCSNEHTIGEDGVHLVGSGLDQFLEQSLVSRGAARNAKIVGRAKARMSADRYTALTADGRSPEATVLFASASPIPAKTPENPMDLTTLVASLTDAKASLQVEQAAHTALKASNTTLTETVATLTAEVETLKAAAKPELADVQAKLTASEAALGAAMEYVRAEGHRLAIACGDTAPAEGADLTTLVASINTSRTKLSASIPVGGRALSADAGNGTDVTSKVPASGSFKLRSN